MNNQFYVVLLKHRQIWLCAKHEFDSQSCKIKKNLHIKDIDIFSQLNERFFNIWIMLLVYVYELQYDSSVTPLCVTTKFLQGESSRELFTCLEI
jgi:hypothetical protein